MEKYDDDLELNKKEIKSRVQRKEESRNNKKKNIVVKRRLSKKGMLYTSLFVGFFLVISLGFYIFSPKIILKGKKHIKINYGEKYEEAGATGKFLGKDVTKDLTRTGSVDTKTVGKYKISYNVKKSIFNITVSRTIEVVDEKDPVIELTGEKEVNVCPNGEYKEDGYKAYDEYDGDLTDKVKITKNKDKIIYKVEDSSRNKIEMIRKLNRVDKDAPKITLTGGETYYVKLENEYKEPGYEATDNCDGDLTDKVEVNGKVDTTKEEVYEITYKVTDSNKNETTITRKVLVYKKTDVNSGESKPGVIYLTFDDGPSSATTPDILDVLKDEGVKATFFVTNSGPDNLIKREFDEGHAVALHTASHDYAKVYSSVDNYFKDLETVQSRVERITGVKSNIIRFPGGSSNTISRRYDNGSKIMTTLTNEVLNRGYRYYDWNVDASDAWTCAKASVSDKKGCVYKNVTNNLSKSRPNIVLMHDIKYHTKDAIRDIIRYGKKNGYTFAKLDDNVKMIRFTVNN